MMQLDNFLEIARAGREALEPARVVYRMDDTSPFFNMRKSAGLGTCNCCDYFTFGNAGTIILIEETELARQIADLKNRYLGLNSEERNKQIRQIIKQENRLKVYGSLLVLCRLARKLTDAQEIDALSKIVDFWLVISGIETDDYLEILDNLRDELLLDLRGVLTNAVVRDVKILSASQAGQRLPSHPSENIGSLDRPCRRSAVWRRFSALWRRFIR